MSVVGNVCNSDDFFEGDNLDCSDDVDDIDVVYEESSEEIGEYN